MMNLLNDAKHWDISNIRYRVMHNGHVLRCYNSLYRARLYRWLYYVTNRQKAKIVKVTTFRIYSSSFDTYYNVD